MTSVSMGVKKVFQGVEKLGRKKVLGQAKKLGMKANRYVKMETNSITNHYLGDTSARYGT